MTLKFSGLEDPFTLIDAADLGDGGDGDGFGGVAEGGDDALLLGGEAGEEVTKDDLEGIIALRATAQMSGVFGGLMVNVTHSSSDECWRV